MKTIQANEMTDEQWRSFAKFENNLMREYYPQHWIGKDKDWLEIKNKWLTEVSLTNNSFSNSYYIFNGNNVIAYIDAYERMGRLIFDYDFSGDLIESDVLKIILAELKNIFSDRNKDYATFNTIYERHYESIIGTGVEIADENLVSRLLKKDLDFAFLNKVIEENKNVGNFELKLFRDIPEDIHQELVLYRNEVGNDMNEFSPKKKNVMEFTMNDMQNWVKDMKDENDIFYMYALFDKEKIAAYCSVCIITIDNKPAIEHGGNLNSVGRKYRGKGFAKYLKAKMYLKIQEDYPEFEQIFTDTYPWNKYMYRINEEFGFKPYQKGYTFRFTKEFLENFLK